ncbi:MAG: 2-oxoglutarate dehydrogenase, component, dihydrolipoamide succinyltransferase [Burkholderiales bacterium]|jgi:2-oxoglutarate dehydrogenase E2 component (dihydrolipoamide succinyltransferase)|nr:2-oxoglutarate dehydrogenase, component, dihydrolipoamide succinyltransferase [Burkholderiales bacterium]
MDVIMPQLGETVAEGTVTRWYKKVGDAVKVDESLFDVETDKVSTEIPAPANGVLAEIVVPEGGTAKVGARLAVIREDAAAAAAAGSPRAQPAAQREHAATARRSAESQPLRAVAAERLSPVVRKLCAEHALDPKHITGTGRDGRLTREDVLQHLATRGGGGQAHSVTPAARTLQAEAPAGAPSAIALNNVRRRTAEHMTNSWTTVPHVMQAVEADFHRVAEARRRAGEQWKQREGFALTYLPFIARAVSVALSKFPNLNATFDGTQLALRRRINLGIAVDLNFQGLVVPVVKDVPSKSLPQLAREINDLATRARAGRLKPDDLTEATYTITNNGAFGTLFTAPIINAPQIAILSTDAVRKRPVVIEAADGDSIAIRPVGVLAQSFDHRAVDGAYAAAFLQEVKSVIESRDWLQALDA